MKGSLSKSLLALAAVVSASLACSALSAIADRPLFSDDFSGSDTNWGTGTTENSSVEYDNSALHVRVFKDNYIVWSTPNDTDFENIHEEVTVLNNGTDSNTAFGLICYQQTISDSYYYMVITPAGEYAIAKAELTQDDVFLTNNNDWAKSDAIAKDAKSYRLGVDCGNGKLTLYVDGKQIDSVSDTTYTKGVAGIQVWSDSPAKNVDVTFDDFVVTKLK
jgi:hypothetical protein